MYNFSQFVFALFVCTARAGIIGSLGYGHAPVAIAAPVAVHAPVAVAAPAVAVAHGASSYQNSNLLALHPTPVITKVAAPVVAAPVAVAPIGLGLGKYIFISYRFIYVQCLYTFNYIFPFCLFSGYGKNYAIGGYHWTDETHWLIEKCN